MSVLHWLATVVTRLWHRATPSDRIRFALAGFAVPVALVLAVSASSPEGDKPSAGPEPTRSGQAFRESDTAAGHESLHEEDGGQSLSAPAVQRADVILESFETFFPGRLARVLPRPAEAAVRPPMRGEVLPPGGRLAATQAPGAGGEQVHAAQ